VTIQTKFPLPVKRGSEPTVSHDEAVSRARDWAITAERLVHEAMSLSAQTSPAGRIDLANTAANISRAWASYAVSTEDTPT